MKAIILAAGLGTRLRPLTNEIPKCMVPVCGTPMVERQIQFLHEAGIQDIVLVSGYRAEKLEPLKEKYGVEIVRNEKYEVCNNIYSMFSVIEALGEDRLEDNFMIDGDTYLYTNPFLAFTKGAGAEPVPGTEPVSGTDLVGATWPTTYLSAWHPTPVNEWALVVDENHHLTDIQIGEVTGYIMSGISYWAPKDARLLAAKVKEAIATRDYTDLFWDHIVLENFHEMDIRVREFDDIYEVDSEADLRALEEKIQKMNDLS